jgi:predicted DNA-binding transcriptional regulator AlpA
VLATSPAPPTLGDRATGDGVLSLHLRRSAPAQPYKIEWVSIPELAERIGMAKESVYRLARAGQFPGAVKMGRRYIVNYSAFVAASSEPINAAAFRS